MDSHDQLGLPLREAYRQIAEKQSVSHRAMYDIDFVLINNPADFLSQSKVQSPFSMKLECLHFATVNIILEIIAKAIRQNVFLEMFSRQAIHQIHELRFSASAP